MLEHNTEIVLLLNPSQGLCCQICSLRLWRQAKQRSDTTKNWEIWDLHECRASQLQKLLVSLLKTSYCSMSGSLGIWKLTFVWIYQLSDHPGLVSLAHGDVGFLPAAGWWQEEMDCFPIPQKSCHIQWLASFKGKPYFFWKQIVIGRGIFLLTSSSSSSSWTSV